MKERLIRQRELTARLNTYRDEYYNQNAPSVSDAVYDRLFDELTELEEETGVVMSNSPTQTVGYPVVSRLPQAKHDTSTEIQSSSTIAGRMKSFLVSIMAFSLL